MAQTPTQRRANNKYARTEEKRMGKSENAAINRRNKEKATKKKSPISPIWIVLLAFVVFGGIAFELLKLFPVAWDFLAAILQDVGSLFSSSSSAGAGAGGGKDRDT